jgi:hypothetical protein
MSYSIGRGEAQDLVGGCFCGFVRYSARGAPYHETLCHCTSCRGTSGAPVVAWFSVRMDDFALTAGEPGRFRSSAHATRSFCPRCGTQLTFSSTDSPDEIAVTSASLDRPEAVAPRDHTWVHSQLKWLELLDGRPRFDRGREE